MAQMFFAVCTPQGVIAALKKTFPVETVRNLPTKKEHCRQQAGRGRHGAADTQKGRAQHQVIPIIDAAGNTAAIVHHPGLEGAEEQNADNIAHTIKSRQTDEKAIFQLPPCVPQKKQRICRGPDEQHHKCTPVSLPHFLHRWFSVSALESFREQLLTAQAF